MHPLKIISIGGGFWNRTVFCSSGTSTVASLALCDDKRGCLGWRSDCPYDDSGFLEISLDSCQPMELLVAILLTLKIFARKVFFPGSESFSLSWALYWSMIVQAILFNLYSGGTKPFPDLYLLMCSCRWSDAVLKCSSCLSWSCINLNISICGVVLLTSLKWICMRLMYCHTLISASNVGSVNASVILARWTSDRSSGWLSLMRSVKKPTPFCSVS